MILSQAELIRITTLPSLSARDRMDAAIFAVLITTALHPTQLAELQTKDYKNGERVGNTWLTGPVSFVLDLHRADCDVKCLSLLQNTTRGKTPRTLHRHTVRDSLKRSAKRASTKPFSPRDCRKTVAATLRDMGINLFIVSDLLGDKSVETTRLYDKHPEH